MKELNIVAITKNLDKVITFIKEELELVKCPTKILMQIAIAVEEIFVNISHYAYNPMTGNVNIKCFITKSPMTANIEFTDMGKPYNPLEKDDPNVKLSVKNKDIGGLGIFIVKNSMTEVSYEYKDNRNVLIIKKIIE